MKQGEAHQSRIESYILRIYRREDKNEQGLVGTITDTVNGKQGAFKTIQELIQWLLKIEGNR